MGSSLEMIKTLIVPAFISLSIYLLFGYLIIPFFQRHRQRYAQYLPVNSISAHTFPIRERIADALMHFFLPSTWRLRRVVNGADDEEGEGENGNHRGNSDSISIFDEEGENMADMNSMSSARREALEARRSTSDAQVRLGRDLEEGFMDDSEDEEEGGDGRAR